jgi:hypothetical protein
MCVVLASTLDCVRFSSAGRLFSNTACGTPLQHCILPSRNVQPKHTVSAAASAQRERDELAANLMITFQNRELTHASPGVFIVEVK